MNYREVELLARKEYLADATEVIDLDMNDPISQIQVTHEPYNSNQNLSTAHPAACVTDITLKDGSGVLYNLNGYQAQAADYYHNNKAPYARFWGLNDNVSIMLYNLNFGRKMWDKELALDPSNFSNLQLSISMAMAAGGCVPDKGYLTVTASLFDEKKIEPAGFFTHKEHKSYSGGSATHERVSLPIDNAYRMLMFRCLTPDHNSTTLYDTIKLEEDNGKKVPIDLTSAELMQAIMGRWIPYEETLIFPGYTLVKNWHRAPTHEVHGASEGWHPNTALYYSAYGSEGGRMAVTASTQGPNGQIVTRGYSPHGAIAIPFGDLQDLDDWYEMEKVESLVVDTLNKSDGSGETFEIFSQQLRRY